MKDSLHRILSGSPESRTQLIAAGLFVGLWFAMDLIEFVDWANQKLHPMPVTCGPSIPQAQGKTP